MPEGLLLLLWVRRWPTRDADGAEAIHGVIASRDAIALDRRRTEGLHRKYVSAPQSYKALWQSPVPSSHQHASPPDPLSRPAIATAAGLRPAAARLCRLRGRLSNLLLLLEVDLP